MWFFSSNFDEILHLFTVDVCVGGVVVGEKCAVVAHSVNDVVCVASANDIYSHLCSK